MEKKVIWHKRAMQQLDDLANYISSDSPENAEKVAERILQKIYQLPVNPEIYPPDRYKKKNNNNNYRAFMVYKFRVSYYITGTKIAIVRIRHTGMSPQTY